MVEFNSDNNNFSIENSGYPQNAELIGIEDNGLKIFIERSNLFGIEEYLRSDTNNELGGVLTGNVYKNNSGDLFIVIKNNIIAESTTASLSRLTFTHDTWEKINSNLEKNLPEQKILGWYHSHPGHSVFLSTYDIFIQDNFFNLPYMTAFVYDPLINDRGFFYKDSSGIKKASGYYVYGDKYENETELVSPPEINIEMPKPLESKPDSSMKNIVLYVLIFVNFLFSVLLFFKMNSYDRELSRFENVNNQLNELKNENSKLQSRIDNLTQSLEADRINSTDTTKQIIKK